MATVKGQSSKAVIYTRVSTEAQTEGTSLAGQFAACAKWAQDEGAVVVKAFEETKSGGLYTTREELQKALSIIEKGEAQILILAKLDRTGRDADALRDIRRRVEKAGARLVFADGMQFEKGAVGNFTFTVMSGVAEMEREMIRERTGAGQVRLAASGKTPNPKSPFGYYIWKKSDVIKELCSPEERGTYSLKQEEARWVKPLFERMASGESTRALATWLQRQGVPTRTGTPWHPATIVQLIQNPVYFGRPVWRRNRRVTDESRAAEGRGISYDVARPQEEHFVFEAPALISEELWRRANETLSAGRSERSGRNDARYMLTGLLACPLCGCRLNTVPTSMGRLDPKQRTHLYRCKGAVRRNGGAARVCDFPSVVGPGLEAHVIAALTELLEDPSTIAKSVTQFKSAQKARAQDGNESARLRHIEREIAACHQREEVAATKEVEAAIAGQDGAIFASLRNRDALKRKELEAEREALTIRQTVNNLTVPEVEVDVATRLVRALYDEGVSPIDKNALLRPFVKVVYPRLVPIEMRVSARAWRARGCPEPVEGDGKGHPYARHLGGCDIILRFGEGVAFILSRHMVRWEVAKDKGRRKMLIPVFDTSLRVEERNPFPLQWKAPSHLLTRDLGI